MSAALADISNVDSVSTDVGHNVVVVDFRSASTPSGDIAQKIAAEAAEILGKDRQGGIKGLASGRSDIFRINPYLLNFKPNWNSRDMADPANLAHIDATARSIAEHGVKDTLVIFSENGTQYVSDGHIRLLATFRAIEVYGAEIKTVPVEMEPRHATPADIALTQLVRNGGSKGLTIFEKGELFNKILGLGWDIKQIAAKALLTEVRVTQILELRAGATPEIKALVNAGKVSSSFAWQEIKKANGDSAAALAALTGAVDVAAAAGKAKATPKHRRQAQASTEPRVARLSRSALHDVFKRSVVDDRSEGKVTITLSAEDFEKARETLGL